MKSFQPMHRINPEGLYGVIQASFPYFEKNNWKGRIIVVSPPIYSRFFRGKTAYAMGKVGMSVLTKGLAMDFERERKVDMAVTSIWPAAAIQSTATGQHVADDSSVLKDLRKPEIFSDSILAIIRSPAFSVDDLLTPDEGFLLSVGNVTDFTKYTVVPEATVVELCHGVSSTCEWMSRMTRLVGSTAPIFKALDPSFKWPGI
ncbi:hypothetical protein MMC09_004194 [Bachmanniomyces sp. S44760]|nr:hypothetical protein [Bachmanniomyces sp. S44760]